MGRHSKDEKNTEEKIDKRRKDALDKFFGLTDKAIAHITWSMKATVVCTACSLTVDGKYTPGKAKTEDGKCGMCANTGVVPDKSQRNWATGEIAERVAPKPKAVEMTVDKASDRKELEQELSSSSDADLDKQLEALGVKVQQNEESLEG